MKAFKCIGLRMNVGFCVKGKNCLEISLKTQCLYIYSMVINTKNHLEKKNTNEKGLQIKITVRIETNQGNDYS